MTKDIIRIIDWKSFLEHSIVKAFIENHDETEFIKNIMIFMEGDEDFRKTVGVDSLTDQDIMVIINYINTVNSRRRFLKGTAALAVLAATGLKGDNKSTAPVQTSYHGKLPVKGIGYDIGTIYTPTFITNSEITPKLMDLHMNVIKNKLNCNAVRIFGEDIDRLIECSKIAMVYGLQVWFSPRLINGSEAETINYIKKCAVDAEKLRLIYPNIVFSIANELTLDMNGFIPGDTYLERGRNLLKDAIMNKIKSIFTNDDMSNRLNKLLKIIVSEVRQYFKGLISYGAGNWENVDWNFFDIVGINHYLNAINKITYKKTLRELHNFKKPIAVLEFGCGSYKGAELKGGSSYDIINWNASRPEIIGNKTKDENVQANYILKLLDIFVKEGVYASFIHTFIETHYITDDENPKHDLDTASFNVIKVYPKGHPKSYFDGHIIPKKSFDAIANFYVKH